MALPANNKLAFIMASNLPYSQGDQCMVITYMSPRSFRIIFASWPDILR